VSEEKRGMLVTSHMLEWLLSAKVTAPSNLAAPYPHTSCLLILKTPHLHKIPPKPKKKKKKTRRRRNPRLHRKRNNYPTEKEFSERERERFSTWIKKEEQEKMSVASSIPYIKIPNPSSSSSSSCSSLSSSSSTSSTSSYYRFSTTTKPYIVTIRSSQAEGPVRRPVAPPLREPSPPASPSPPLKPVPPSSPSSPVAPPPKPAAKVAVEDKNVMTLEFQRQKAKELQEYFKQKKLEEADQGPFFGFFGKNEIANGR
jgi:hypothetical protein